MSLSLRAFAFNIGTGALGTTVAVTGLGFQPKALVFFAIGLTASTDQAVAGDARRMIGFAADCAGTIKNRVVAGWSENGNVAPDSSAQHHNRNDACVLALLTTGAVEGRASLTSLDADGFTLTIDDAFANSYRVIGLAIGGTDVTDIEIGTYTHVIAGTPPFTEDVALPFTCLDDEAVGIHCWTRQTAPNINNIDSDMGFGFWTSAGSQVNWHGGTNSAPAALTQAIRHFRNGQVFSSSSSSQQGPNRRATFHSWQPSAFRWTWDEIFTDAILSHWMVIKGGKWKVLTGSTLTTLASIALTAAGFPPLGGLLFSHLTSESGVDSTQDSDGVSLGVYDSPTSRFAVGQFDQDNVDPSAVATAIEHDEVYVNINQTGAVQGLMDVQSLDSDGVTFVMDNADPVASFFATLVGGSAGSGTPPTFRSRIVQTRQAVKRASLW